MKESKETESESMLKSWRKLVQSGAFLSITFMLGYAVFDSPAVRAILVSVLGGSVVMAYYILDWQIEQYWKDRKDRK